MLIGQGIARHHFWGDYKATITVAFLQTHLTAPEMLEAVKTALPSFDVDEDEDTGRVIAYFIGGDKALDTAVTELVAAGAERSKILSIARSIDWGEQFTVDITPLPTEVQQHLSLEA
jgi:hypothetical protein